MENKKNIWLISQYTGSPYHGMNYRGYYLSNEFVKEGHSVTIFSASYSHLLVTLPSVNTTFTEENIDGIDYIWVKTPVYKSSKSIKRVWSMLVFMSRLFYFNIFKRDKPDVIIVSSLSLFPVLNAYIWSKIFKIEFIFEVRDIWPLTLIEIGGFSKYHPLVFILGLFEKLGYKKAKYVVSVLPKANLHMSTKGMAKEKFQYIPNGISMDEMNNIQNIEKETQEKLPLNKFIVGYLGTIGIANSLEYFLKTAKELHLNSNIHFVLVGRGDEKEKLLLYVKTHNLSNVTFIEAIPKIQVQSILKYFDVCYITAKKKNIYKYGISANKLFDYMYSATPIIYAIDSGENLIDQAKCGVSIPSEDIDKLKETIIELVASNSNKLDKMGENGKMYVEEHHIYFSLAKKYIKLMENMKT